jgi:hypothetical protein
MAIREIFTDILEEDIDNVEMGWIKILKDYCHYKLTNLTLGGEGGKGYTPEINKKAAAKRIGQKRSLETRKKLSEIRKGIKFSDEHKLKLSIARKKRIIKKETRIKMHNSSVGKVNIKKHKLLSPEGLLCVTTQGLRDFCRKVGITNPTNLYKTYTGERKHHQGWKLLGELK